jgi:hypothetical protein
MDKIVREIVQECWEWDRLGRTRDFVDRDQVFAKTLIQMESEGDAMRFLDAKGRVRWRATPQLLGYLSDLKIDALEDFWQEDA